LTRTWPVAIGSAAIFAVTTTISAYLGYLTIFTGFFPYDDEGYMLVSLRSFIAGQALYDRVFTQYGPFPFEVFGALGALGLNFDHDTGRLVTLAMWIGLSLLIGVAVFVFTRNLGLGLATQLVAFSTATTLTDEPMHPDGLVVLLVMGIAAAPLLLGMRTPRPRFFIAVGVLAAAAALTKINVGGFAIVSIAFACVVTIPALARIWPLRLLAALAMFAVPFVLMKGDLGEAWAQRYSLHVGLCVAALVIAVSASRPDARLRISALGWIVGAGVAAAAVILLVAVVLGTSPSGLVHGIVLNPLNQPKAFSLPLLLPGSTLIWDGLGIAGAALWTVYRQAMRPYPRLEGAVRLLAGLAIWLNLLGDVRVPGVFLLTTLNQRLVLPLALAWIVAAPRGGLREFEPLDFARCMLPALAVLQSLHAYPVAGSQQAFSALPLVPLGALCIADGLALLGLTALRLQAAAALLFAVIAVSWLPPAWQVARQSYQANVPAGLHGAARVRIPAEQASTLSQVTDSLRGSCDTYISYPGMDSFYLFAQMQPPTGFNPTGWMWLMSEDQQRQVVAASQSINRLCVVENDGIVAYWAQGRPIPRGPLLDYIQQNFMPEYSVGGYTILVRRT
jgi:hypothetical protein